MLTIKKVVTRIDILISGYFSGNYSLTFTYENVDGFVCAIPELDKEQLDLPIILAKIGRSSSNIYWELLDQLNIIEMEVAINAYRLEQGIKSDVNIITVNNSLYTIQKVCKKILFELDLYPSEYDED